MKWSINYCYCIFDQNLSFTRIFSGIGIRVFLSPFKLKDRKQKSKKTFRKKLHCQTPFQKEEITHPWCVTKICHTHIILHGQILSMQQSKFSIRKKGHCSYTINEFAMQGNCPCLSYITLFWVSQRSVDKIPWSDHPQWLQSYSYVSISGPIYSWLARGSAETICICSIH